MDISTPAEIRFIPHSDPWQSGVLECSAHCYRTDPDRYLNAVKGVDS